MLVSPETHPDEPVLRKASIRVIGDGPPGTGCFEAPLPGSSSIHQLNISFATTAALAIATCRHRKWV
jgi:hypothetical protein